MALKCARITFLLLASAACALWVLDPGTHEIEVLEFMASRGGPPVSLVDYARQPPDTRRMKAVNAKLEARIRAVGRLEAGVKTYQSNRLDDADSIFSSLIAAGGPAAHFAHLNRGVILDRRGQPRAALLEYEEALKAFPPFMDEFRCAYGWPLEPRPGHQFRARCHYAMGVAWEKLGKTTAATRAFDLARTEEARAARRAR